MSDRNYPTFQGNALMMEAESPSEMLVTADTLDLCLALFMSS
jgi:hypothetical protein